MPPWCLSSTLYKGLLTLLLALIAIEYFFGSIIESKHGDSVFTTNSTRLPAVDSSIHSYSVLLKALHNTSINRNSTHNISFSSLFSNSSSTNTTTNLNSIISSLNVSGLFDISSESETSLNAYRSVTTLVPLCPEVPPNLSGRVKVLKSPVPSVQELEQRFSWLQPGGHWYPESCRVKKKVAVIIPFRCRGEHLLLFLQHMHPFLKRQQVDYTMFIIEQDGDFFFNRAMLMNVGFKEALKLNDFDCFIFHDIDLLPEDDRNLYTCPEQPRHMSVAVDIMKYTLPYRNIFGGVSAISKEHFQLLNGFSNSFWGWGGEDDDMSNRINYHKLHISRYPITIARYTMLTHKKDMPNFNRYELLKLGKKKFDTDGLNSLNYTIKQMKKNLLYTWLLVKIDHPS